MKDLNASQLPEKLIFNSLAMDPAFADYFSNIVKTITQDCKIDINVNDGKKFFIQTTPISWLVQILWMQLNL